MKKRLLAVLIVIFALIFKFSGPVQAIKEIVYSFTVAGFLSKDWIFYIYDKTNGNLPMGNVELCLEGAINVCGVSDSKYGEVGWISLPYGDYSVSIDIPQGYRFDSYYKVPDTYNTVLFYLSEIPEVTPLPTPTPTPTAIPVPAPLPVFSLENVVLDNPVIGDEFEVNINVGVTNNSFTSAYMGINYDENVFEVISVEKKAIGTMVYTTEFPYYTGYDLAISYGNILFDQNMPNIATIRMRLKALPTISTDYRFSWVKLYVDYITEEKSAEGVDGTVRIRLAEPTPTPTPIPTPICKNKKKCPIPIPTTIPLPISYY